LLVGLAQATKYTAVLLFPLLLLLAITRDGPRLYRAAGRGRLWRKYIGRSLILVALFGGVAILVVNLAFLRERTGLPLQVCPFLSRPFLALREATRTAGWLRVPVPAPYLLGLDGVIYRDSLGTAHGPAYLLGSIRRSEGFGYRCHLKTPSGLRPSSFSLVGLARASGGG
jgi:hypothetical protein